MIHSQRKIQEQEVLMKTQSKEEIKLGQMQEYPLGKRKFLKKNLVIFCDPNQPIYFLESFLQLIESHLSVSVSTHVHSTVTKFPSELSRFCSNFYDTDMNVNISITLIWKTIGIDPIMIVSGMQNIILGMVNIARYLNRLIETINTNVLKYERNGTLYANKIDSYLDKIHCALHNIKRDVNTSQKICKKTRYVMGNDISIVDLILKDIDKYKIKRELIY